MEKSERQLIEDANDILRSINSVVERKGFNTNWESLDKKIKMILKEQRKYMYPTVKDIRLKKLNNINGKN
jgi:hypothetical protein